MKGVVAREATQIIVDAINTKNVFCEISATKGAFSHSANYYVVYPGNTPENYPPTEACMINSKQHGVQNSGRWDPWQVSD